MRYVELEELLRESDVVNLHVASTPETRHLIGQHEDQVAEVAMEDDSIFLDIDTPEALTAIGGDAAVLAVVMISVLLAVILKSFKDVVLVFMPLLLAVLLTIATSVLLGLSFNYANVIVLPLLFGLGVASGIHLVLRRRNEGAAVGVFGTSTPRAVVFSGLTTIGSFGTIALSGHPGTSSMGLLLAISITLTLGCTLVVLPALMVFWRGAAEQEAS